MELDPISEDSILITLGDRIDETLPPRIARLCEQIRQKLGPVVTDLVPSYTTVLCCYDPMRMDFRGMRQALAPLLGAAPDQGPAADADTTIVEIPVWYAPEAGADLEEQAHACDMTIAELIRRHTNPTYLVYAIGFSPGFAFMGQVDPDIARPRKATPRTRVPRGSVGIANRQTAVYPSVSPGGWQLIGRSPERLFDERRLARLQVGDRVRFRAIERQDFLDLGGEL